MRRWSVVVCIALLASAGVRAAEPSLSPPAAKPAGKAAKRKAPVAKPAPPPVAPKPLHLSLHGPGLRRHLPAWHLESVPAPGTGPQGNTSGVRALALTGAPADEQRIEFGVAPLVPLKLPTNITTGPDGSAAARPPGTKNALPVAQVYMRYSW